MEISGVYSLNTFFGRDEDFCLTVENNRIIKEEAGTELVTSIDNLLNNKRKESLMSGRPHVVVLNCSTSPLCCMNYQ